jgi:hypothetical protein
MRDESQKTICVEDQSDRDSDQQSKLDSVGWGFLGVLSTVDDAIVDESYKSKKDEQPDSMYVGTVCNEKDSKKRNEGIPRHEDAKGVLSSGVDEKRDNVVRDYKDDICSRLDVVIEEITSQRPQESPPKG